MKRIISTLTLSAFVGMSALSAQSQLATPAPSVQESALTKDDANFLFGKNAESLNVQVLSQKELEETKGEFWPAIGIGLGISAASYGLCAIFSKGCRFDLNFGSRF